MVKTPSVDKNGIKKGLWSKEEDDKLKTFIESHGHKNWRQLPKIAGLSRCGKSCRLRWMNYLRPGLKKGAFSVQEDEIIVKLHNKLGNKWSAIAELLPGRSDNEIKNHWHTHLKNRAKQTQKPEESMEELLPPSAETSEFSDFEFKPTQDDIFNILNLDEVSLPQNSQTLDIPLSQEVSAVSGGGISSSSSSSSISDWILDDISTLSLESFMDPLESFWTEPFVSDTIYPKNVGYPVTLFEGENFPVQTSLLGGDIVPPCFEDAAWY